MGRKHTHDVKELIEQPTNIIIPKNYQEIAWDRQIKTGNHQHMSKWSTHI